MKISAAKTVLAGIVSVAIAFGAGTTFAADGLSSQMSTAFTKKDVAALDALLKKPTQVDEVMKAMMKKTQELMTFDPAFSGEMMKLTAQYAPQITPPSVPLLCSDMRRIVGALGPDDVGSTLFSSVLDASDKLSKAPVVVAAGRPNECEESFIQIATLSGDEALLAMLPGMRSPGVRPVLPLFGNPKQPTNEEKPSAD